LLDYPQYTRPAEFRGWSVPEVLRSGNHAAIAQWRRQQQLLRTWQRRPDLLEQATLSEEERQFLQTLQEAHHAETSDRDGHSSGDVGCD
jgi:tRNA (guanine37-N1)-methyltransferase